MKLGTLVKIAALAVAAGSTAAGTIMVTTKALKKVGNDDKTETPVAAAPVEPTPAPAFTPAPAPEVIPVAEPAPAPTPVSEPYIPEEFKVEPIVVEAPVEAAPIVEKEAYIPQEFAAPAADVVAPVEADLPNIEAPAEPAPVYTDFVLPYAAASAGANDDIVIGGAVKEEAPVAEEITVAPVIEEAPIEVAPVVEEIPVAPVAEEIPVAPVIEEAPIAEPIVDAPVSGLDLINAALASEPVVEPEIVLSTQEPIAAEPTDEPALPTAEVAPVEDPLADMNPLAQGFTVSITEDAGAEALPPVADVPPMEDFAAAPIAEPATFETIAPVEEPIAEPVAEAAPVVDEAPVVEAAPIVSAVPAGNIKTIGDSVVSDEPTNANIQAVANKFNVPAKNLVSIAAEGQMPMVFEFLYDDMRTDATLMSVYFIIDGEAVLPPETDRETVLATGRNFITDNEELKAFLA